MSCSITIVIPNRNRDLHTVKRSLDSIDPQLTEGTKLVIIDYGSQVNYQSQLKKLTSSFSGIDLILCPTQGQLWNKARCINIVLKSCKTTHLMVCDMDMIWHPHFLENQKKSLSQKKSVYFTVGIMTQEESVLEKEFIDYDIKFATNEEATGITVFPTEQLKSINGFDEFYHGWGSEDTDVHMRLQNAGYQVHFYNSKVYFKHQWHEKGYRSVSSGYPFHTRLERINAAYLDQTKICKAIKANNRYSWGSMPVKGALSSIVEIKIDSYEQKIKGVLSAMLENRGSYSLEVDCSQSFSFKNVIKLLSNRHKWIPLKREASNNLILEWIITNSRNTYYNYKVVGEKILLKITIE